MRKLHQLRRQPTGLNDVTFTGKIFSSVTLCIQFIHSLRDFQPSRSRNEPFIVHSGTVSNLKGSQCPFAEILDRPINIDRGIVSDDDLLKIGQPPSRGFLIRYTAVHCKPDPNELVWYHVEDFESDELRIRECIICCGHLSHLEAFQFRPHRTNGAEVVDRHDDWMRVS